MPLDHSFNPVLDIAVEPANNMQTDNDDKKDCLVGFRPELAAKLAICAATTLTWLFIGAAISRGNPKLTLLIAMGGSFLTSPCAVYGAEQTACFNRFFRPVHPAHNQQASIEQNQGYMENTLNPGAEV